MRVGCPKEIKNHEYRVGLTPGAVREYSAHGHEVIVETGAGAGIGADDNAYRAAGAQIVKTAEDVFARADMVDALKGFADAELDGFLDDWYAPATQAALQALVARLKK